MDGATLLGALLLLLAVIALVTATSHHPHDKD